MLASIPLMPLIALAQSSDTTAPQLVDLSFSPVAIDVTRGPQEVKVTLDVTDDLAGVRTVFVAFKSPSGAQRRDGLASLTGGTHLAGTWQLVLTFPQFLEDGTWEVETVVLEDLTCSPQTSCGGGNNVIRLNTATLQAMGLPTELPVISDPDTAPPQLTGFELNPRSIDVSTGSKPVTISLGLIDIPAGVDFEWRSGPNTSSSGFVMQLVSPSGAQVHRLTNHDFTIADGTNQNGTWRANLTVPQYSEGGTWKVENLRFEDFVSNTTVLKSAEIEKLGFSPNLNALSQPSDISPPDLLSFDFLPAVISSSIGSSQVTVTMRVADDLSGVDFSPSNPGRGISIFHGVRFRSPSGAQNQALHSSSQTTLVSGTPLNGVWEGTVTFPRSSEAGVWKVETVVLKDATKNFISWDSFDLEAKGFPTKLEITDLGVLHAASFSGGSFAPNQIVSVFGPNLAESTATAQETPLPTLLAGTTVTITDSTGVERSAALFFASRTQINCLIPPETATGPAALTVRTADGESVTAPIVIETVAPGLFSADASGRGVAAAFFLRDASDGSRGEGLTFDPETRAAVPINLGPEGDEVFLLLFGTGIRGFTTEVTATVGGESVPVLFAGPQGVFVGLDQINIGPIPRSLVRAGEVTIALTVDDKLADFVAVSFSRPSVPQLLAPINDASIPQNNPNIGCPSNPRRGYGLAILFDWTDSTSPTGVAGYEIYARKRDALSPIINTFVTISQYYYKSCNSFANDLFLTNWEWRVRAKDNAGNYSDWTPTAVYQLAPCRLEDGTSCRG